MRTITSVLLLFGFTLLAEAQQPVRYIVELQNEPVFSPRNRRASSAAVLSTAPLRGTRSADGSDLSFDPRGSSAAALRISPQRGPGSAAESILAARARMAPALASADSSLTAATASRPSPQEQAAALALVQRQQTDFDSRAAAFGFRSIRHIAHVTNVVVVEGLPGSEAALRALPGVKRVAQERIYHKHFDASIGIHQIDSAWAAIPGATYNPANPSAGVWNPAGQGVKIGIVDTGIDPTHPAFYAPSMTAPSGFPKWNSDVAQNQTVTSGKIIVARSYGGQIAQDIDGHGTAVAQLAAGVVIPASQGPAGNSLSGVAPAAWLGIYDIDSALNGSYADSDILAALDDCGTDGMDVVSMSFGAPDYGGTADPLNQTYNDAFVILRNLGIVLVASSGNDGPDPYSIAAPGVDPAVIAAGAQQSTSLLVDASVTGAGISTPIAAAAGDNNTDMFPALAASLADVRTWDSTGLGCTNGSAWPKSNVATGKILVVQRGTCNFSMKLQNAHTSGAAAVIVFNYAVPPDGSDPNSLVTMQLEIGVNPAAIANYPAIFVGYNDGLTLRAAAATSSIATATFGLVPGDPRQLADFSARGPNADLAIKPELVAIGNSIITANCTDQTLYPSSNSCNPFAYLFWDGSSFASPLTAGAVAVIKSARPGLSADDYRSLVVNTASPMLDSGGNTWPVQAAGAGSLDVLRGVQSTVTVNPVTLSFGTAGSGIPAAQQISLKNVGPSATTYNLTFEGMTVSAPVIAVVPVTASWGWGSVTVLFPAYNASPAFYTSHLPATPDLSVDSLTLTPRATANVTATMPTAGLAPGLYQGFIDVTPTGGSTPHARIPYWYAVPAAAPTRIAFDVTPFYITAGDTQSMILRFVDNSGVLFPAPGSIVVTETAGSAFHSAPYQAISGGFTFPDVWLIDITVPGSASPGTTYTLHVQSGSVGGDFTIISQ